MGPTAGGRLSPGPPRRLGPSVCDVIGAVSVQVSAGDVGTEPAQQRPQREKPARLGPVLRPAAVPVLTIGQTSTTALKVSAGEGAAREGAVLVVPGAVWGVVEVVVPSSARGQRMSGSTRRQEVTPKQDQQQDAVGPVLCSGISLPVLDRTDGAGSGVQRWCDLHRSRCWNLSSQRRLCARDMAGCSRRDVTARRDVTGAVQRWRCYAAHQQRDR